jgi:hypothetical protein
MNPNPAGEAPPSKKVRAEEPDSASKDDGDDKASQDKKADWVPDPVDRPKWASKVKKAQWWYYRDVSRNCQGPFYPGQMRDWFIQGFFTQDQEVGPSFQGEMPQDYARIVEAFEAPVYDTSFVPGEGIANYPPEEQVVEEVKEVTREQLIKNLMEATPGQEFQKSAISFN